MMCEVTCDLDCLLTPWSPWSPCSTSCDIGNYGDHLTYDRGNHIGVGSGAAGAALAAPIFRPVAILGPRFLNMRVVCFITQTQKIANRVVQVSSKFQRFDNSKLLTRVASY